jgi:hypothetical protein
VKPNIFAACGAWIGVIVCLFGIFWNWCRWHPRWKWVAIAAVSLLLIATFRSWAMTQYRAQYGKTEAASMEVLRAKAKPIIKDLRERNKEFLAEFTEDDQNRAQLPFHESVRAADGIRQKHLMQYSLKNAIDVDQIISRLSALGVDVKDLEAAKPQVNALSFEHLANLLEAKFEQKKP